MCTYSGELVLIGLEIGCACKLFVSTNNMGTAFLLESISLKGICSSIDITYYIEKQNDWHTCMSMFVFVNGTVFEN